MGNLKERIILNFIAKERWRYIWDGLGVTLQVTFFSVLMGIALGFLIAIIRSTHDKTGKLKILNSLTCMPTLLQEQFHLKWEKKQKLIIVPLKIILQAITVVQYIWSPLIVLSTIPYSITILWTITAVQLQFTKTTT